MADTPFLSPYAQRITDLIKQQQDLEGAPNAPMFSPEELMQRQGANRRQQQLGTIAELTGDRPLQAVGGPLLKQAMEEQKRRITEHGEYDPISGELKMFPEYTKRVKGERMQKEQARMTELEARAYSTWLSDRQKAQERLNLHAAGGGNTGTYSDAGVDPATGNPVLRNSKSGALVKAGANGEFVPHVGPIGSRPGFEKESKELEGIKGKAALFRDVLSELTTPEGTPSEAGQQAFGGGYAGAASTMIPSQMQGMVQNQLFTPEDQQLRARVYKQAYEAAHDLAGAAMSYGETIRLQPFIPNPGDPAEMIISKMRAAQKEHERLIQRIEDKRNAATSSAGPGPQVQKQTFVPENTPMPAAGAGATVTFDAKGNRVR